MAVRKVANPVHVTYPPTLDTTAFEKAISPLRRLAPASHVVFDCTGVVLAQIDIQVAALLLYNELARKRHRVTLRWSATAHDFLINADRIGFFGLLDPCVQVEPSRPRRADFRDDRQQSNKAMLLEMSAIDISNHDKGADALTSLRESLETNLASFSDKRRQAIVNDIWTFSAETIENIYNHSESPVGGIVAAERYMAAEREPRLRLIIADAGLGMLATIRNGRPRATNCMTDAQIILAAFREGLSRSPIEMGRGCGLPRCAAIAMRHHANLRVRAGASWAFLVTRSKKAGVVLEHYNDDALRIDGTQVTFDFYLDRMSRFP